MVQKSLQHTPVWPLTLVLRLLLHMMEEVLKEAGNWSIQEVECYTGSCRKMEQHLKFFSLFPIPIVPFPTVLVVLSLAFPVQVVQVFLGPASPFPVSPFLGALVVPFLGVLSPVVPVLGALFQVFPFLASLSPASPVPFVHDPASPVPAPSAFVALATVFSGCPTLLVMDHFVLEREAVNSVEAM